MLKHVVVWNIRDPSRKAEDGVVAKAALESVRGRIPGLIAIEAGIDIGADPGAADLALYAEFVDRAALDVYQQHPLHLDVKAIVGPLLKDRRAADWEC